MRALLAANSFTFPVQGHGFNSSHPAAQSCSLSAIPCGANFINLLNGNPGTLGSVPPPAAVNGWIGPCVNFTVANNVILFSGGQTAVSNSATLAAIFQITTSGVDVILVNSGTTNGGVILFNNSGTLTIQVQGVNISTTLSIALNTPYFAAVSFNSTIGGNCVLVNLRSGVTRTSTIAGHAITAIDGSFSVGGYGHSGTPANPMQGFLGPVMVNYAFMSLQQLSIWANDLWAFWFPHPELATLNWLAVPAGAPPPPVLPFMTTGAPLIFT